VPACIETLREKRDQQDQIGAIIALGIYGPESEPAIPLLVQALGDKDEPQRSDYSSIASHAALSLAKIGPAARVAIPQLTKQWENNKAVWGLSRSITVSNEAFALAKLDPGNRLALLTLVQLLKSDDCNQAWLRLAEIGPDAKPIASELVKVMQWYKEHSKVLYAPAELLKKINPDRAAVELKRLGYKELPGPVSPPQPSSRPVPATKIPSS
jgi:HEAT repeat protein